MSKKSGFVSIVGRPNVGKSTLLNHIIGQKLAGVSAKPQTTRDVIKGIFTNKKGQIVFLDTPGVHRPGDLLGKKMLENARGSLHGVDVIYFMVLPKPCGKEEEKILSWIKKQDAKAFLLINQVDCFSKEKVLQVIDQYQHKHDFDEFIPISALQGIQTDIVLNKTFEALPEGEYFFPEDQISDSTERFHAAEIIREKILRLLGQEIPHSTAVVINEFIEVKGKPTHIDATIIVEKESQKKIVIGAKGQKIKEIGISAREELQSFLGAKKVMLKLWVKVRPKWKDNPMFLKEYGYS